MDTCLQHERACEIYCKACKSYLCVCCLHQHADGQHVFQYVHVLKHAMDLGLPRVDQMLHDFSQKEGEMDIRAAQVISDATTALASLKDVASSYAQSTKQLKDLASRVHAQTFPSKKLPLAEEMKKSLISDKRKLEQALKAKDVTTVLRLTRKIEMQEVITENIESHTELFARIKDGLNALPAAHPLTELIATTQQLVFKCQRLSAGQYITEWHCDKEGLSSKVTLSADGLTIQSSGGGYFGVVGNVPIDRGVLSYEVIPSGLCCAKKEGFGFIELESYQVLFAADGGTPMVYENMIGFMYKNAANRMNVESIADMKMNEKYFVKADLGALKLTIQGPGVSLTAQLEPGVAYVPCFSCGCSKNKFVIKPIGAFDDS